MQLSKDLTRREEIDLEKIRVHNTIELKKIEYENADKEHIRNLEMMAKEREYELDDKNKVHERKLEENKIIEAGREKQRQHKLDLAQKLVELKPVFQEYLMQLRNGYDSAYTEQRQEFRDELVEECLKYYREGDGIAYKLIEERLDIVDEEVKLKIENIVNAKFPLNEIPMPFEIKRLIEYLFENSQ